MKLSLIVAYLGRESHLKTKLDWWEDKSRQKPLICLYEGE